MLMPCINIAESAGVEKGTPVHIHAERGRIVIGFPMTHSARHSDNPFAVRIVGPDREVAYILAFQPKSYDWQLRGARLHP
jgi:hypothetical protein